MTNLYKNRIELIIAELESSKWSPGCSSQLGMPGKARNPLGVVCEVYMKITGNGNWERNNMFNVNGDIREYTLPIEVRDYFKFPQTDLILNGEMVRGLTYEKAIAEFRNYINKE